MGETWFKVPSGLVDDPSNVGLSDAAWTLWLHGMSYCSQNLTDGFIPSQMLPRLSSVKKPTLAADELVDAGLWLPVEGGWRIAGYEDTQQTRAKVEAEREKVKERQQRKRDRDKGVTGDVTDASRRDTGVSHNEVRVPDTDTDTDMTTTSPATVYTMPVDNPVTDSGNQQLARDWATAHADFRADKIEHRRAFITATTKKVLALIEEHPDDWRNRAAIQWPIDNPALWDGDDSFGLGLSPPTSVDLCRAKAAEAIGRFKIEVPA